MTAIRETIQAQLSGESGDKVRLDRFLADALQELDYDVSRSQVQQWLAKGFVQSVRTKLKPSDDVVQGDVFEVDVPGETPVEIAGDDVEFEVVYEDDDVVVVNKPRGLVVHPGAGHTRNTLVNGLVGRNTVLSPLGGELRPGVVHRIDKDTSGLLMLAKTDLAYHALAQQLREHSVERLYQAVVQGRIVHEYGTVDAPIGRDPKNRQRMAVTEHGKPSVTHFKVLERFRDTTHLELQLETGRTHQIRVHMAYIGHSLVGDPVYGERQHANLMQGQALHAMTLGFRHPRTGAWLSFSAPLPDDLMRLLELLRGES